jgi:hypothetical protein
MSANSGHIDLNSLHLMIRTLLAAADTLGQEVPRLPETVAITAAKTADGQRQSATVGDASRMKAEAVTPMDTPGRGQPGVQPVRGCPVTLFLVGDSPAAKEVPWSTGDY